MSKLLNTDTLLRLNREAARKRYNRHAANGALSKAVDGRGIHVIETAMEHGDGAQVRCTILVKVLDSDEPRRLVLDVGTGDYNALPALTPEQADALVAE